MTGRENTRFVCRIHGVRDTSTVEEWVKEFSEIGQHYEFIKTYSSGMKSKFSLLLVWLLILIYILPMKLPQCN